MAEDPDRYVVVGVTAHQPPLVVQQATRFARFFRATLVCAHVDTANYVVREFPDGSVESRPVDSDLLDWRSPSFDARLAEQIRATASNAEVPIEFRELAGDIGHALARLAEVLEAEMIVVGSRRGGLRSSVHDFLGGSVAVHLAHQQPRPLVVIPLSPSAKGDLPWGRAKP